MTAELKHLMARVSAIARDRAYLAAVEGFLAHRAAADPSRTVARMEGCWAVSHEIGVQVSMPSAFRRGCRPRNRSGRAKKAAFSVACRSGVDLDQGSGKVG